MPLYKHLNELIRDGLELKLECRQCRHVERADPADAMTYIAAVRRHGRSMGVGAEPDLTLARCADGAKCPICGASDFAVGAIKPLASGAVQED